MCRRIHLSLSLSHSVSISLTLSLPFSFRYFVSMLEGDKSASTPIARDNIIALTNIFVLRQSPSSLLHPSNQTPSSASFVSSGPSLAPAEETQLLLSIQSHMEGIPTLELRYCLLDAIFGGPAIDLKVRRYMCMCACMYMYMYMLYIRIGVCTCLSFCTHVHVTYNCTCAYMCIHVMYLYILAYGLQCVSFSNALLLIIHAHIQCTCTLLYCRLVMDWSC